MILRGDLDLSGLKVALAVELAGNWKEYNDGMAAEISDLEVETVYNEIQAVTGPVAMPPETRLLRLLVDAAAHLHQETARGYGWRVLGIDPKDGRRLLGTGSHRVDWAIWHTAMSFGLGYSRHQSASAYLDENFDN